jgi:hypothetical protein
VTDTATTFAVGDRVRIIGNPDQTPSVVVGISSEIPGLPYRVSAPDGFPFCYAADELERIDVDPEAPTDDAAVSASLEGPSSDDGSSTGATAEPAAEEPPVPTLADLAAQVATLTRRVSHLETIAQWQRGTNEGVLSCLEMLGIQPSPFAGEPPYRTAQVSTPRTTHRLHTKIVKNTKGYGFELSAEATSDDPTKDVTLLVQDLLDCADKHARLHIIDAEYRDANGLPGDDEIDPDQTF